MIKTILFLLNLPWTLLGILVGIVCFPVNIRANKRPIVIVVYVQRLWLNEIFLRRRARGFTLGNTVLLDRRTDSTTYDHEMVHIRQFEKWPLVFPLLYCIQCAGKGYKRDKYEEEARKVSGGSKRRF